MSHSTKLKTAGGVLVTVLIGLVLWWFDLAPLPDFHTGSEEVEITDVTSTVEEVVEDTLDTVETTTHEDAVTDPGVVDTE